MDDEPPTIEDYVAEDGLLSFTVIDTQSGIDYSSIFAANLPAERVCCADKRREFVSGGFLGTFRNGLAGGVRVKLIQ